MNLAPGQGKLRSQANDLLRGRRPNAITAERCPVDRRIEAFLNTYFADLTETMPLRLPESTFLPFWSSQIASTRLAGGPSRRL